MEFGPRALGGRSIIGCPSATGVADRINHQIKFRERWRPFCPSMLDTVAPQMIKVDHPAPFMTFTFEVSEEWKTRVPEVVHEDGTSRAQVLKREYNPRYYDMMKELEVLTGNGVSLNTSLNRRVEAEVYAQAWQRYGGSVATHPQVIERLAGLAQIPVRYLGWEQGGELKGAIATWGRDLALSKDVLKRSGKKGLFDLGNAEIILPIAADAQVPLRHRARYLSTLNEGRVSTLKPQAEQLAMARTPEDLSKKFRYNQRRELRLLEEAGGVVRAVSEFSSVELAAIYCDLFQRR